MQKIYHLFYVKNRFVDYFWRITALSFSVQIATFSINIFYFHQSPLLFPLTNLLAIPIAMAVVIGSLAIFFTSVIPPISSLVAFLLEKRVFIYNQIVLNLSRLTITSIEDLELKGFCDFLIIMMVLFLVRFMEVRRIYLFRGFTLFLALTVLVAFTESNKHARQKKLVIYSVKNKFCMDVFYGNSCYSNVDTGAKSELDVYHNILPNRNYNQISKAEPIENLRTFSSMENNARYWFLEIRLS